MAGEAGVCGAEVEDLGAGGVGRELVEGRIALRLRFTPVGRDVNDIYARNLFYFVKFIV